jgi:hypothetical protein
MKSSLFTCGYDLAPPEGAFEEASSAFAQKSQDLPESLGSGERTHIAPLA